MSFVHSDFRMSGREKEFEEEKKKTMKNNNLSCGDFV
jgi:hypothetical protein